MAADRDQQADELSALAAIYGQDFAVDADAHGCQVRDCSISYCEQVLQVCHVAKAHGATSPQIYVPDLQHTPNVCLRVYLPDVYPSHSPPLAEVAGPHLSEDIRAWVVAELESQFVPGPASFHNVHAVTG